MDDDLFEQLIESTKQAVAISKGEMEAGRVFKFDDPNVQTIRQNFKLSQPKFAKLLGISVGTLRNWEQGRRKPEGPARVLLNIAMTNPDALLKANLAI